MSVAVHVRMNLEKDVENAAREPNYVHDLFGVGQRGGGVCEFGRVETIPDVARKFPQSTFDLVSWRPTPRVALYADLRVLQAVVRLAAIVAREISEVRRGEIEEEFAVGGARILRQ